MRNNILASLLVFALAIALNLSPVQAADYVNLNQTATYYGMTNDIKELSIKYPGLISYKSLGKSPYGRHIWAVKLGKGDATVFYNGSHHGREWISTNITMEMLDQYANAYKNKSIYEGYDVYKLLNDVSIWFVPMVNPDGVTLQQYGPNAFPSTVRASLIRMNRGSTNFKRWKANAQGIDPNRQYPAGWSSITGSPSTPSYKNYKGTKPLQTIENRLLYQFTYYVDPEVAVSYHSAGRILYWHYKTASENYTRDLNMARAFSSMTGYSLVPPSSSGGGGYTDWFITSFKRPGFTPELSYPVYETNPPLSVIPEEWKRNRKAGLYIANEGRKLWEGKLTKKNDLITKFDNTYLYDRPGTAYKTTLRFNAQPATVIAEKGNFFRLNTVHGKKWVSKGNYVTGSITDHTQSPINILLTEQLPLYDLPLAHKITTKSYGPAEVKAVKSYKNWYAVQTPYGVKWISAKNVILHYQPIAIQKEIQLTTVKNLYTHPLEVRKTSTTIQPGKVLATQQWKDMWYFIETPEGNRWVKEYTVQ
jgi:g-D-glutamyl-meso-diaminopimelate peptidase